MAKLYLYPWYMSSIGRGATLPPPDPPNGSDGTRATPYPLIRTNDVVFFKTPPSLNKHPK
jgi:hypothetical protein